MYHQSKQPRQFEGAQHPNHESRDSQNPLSMMTTTTTVAVGPSNGFRRNNKNPYFDQFQQNGIDNSVKVSNESEGIAKIFHYPLIASSEFPLQNNDYNSKHSQKLPFPQTNRQSRERQALMIQQQQYRQNLIEHTQNYFENPQKQFSEEESNDNDFDQLPSEQEIPLANLKQQNIQENEIDKKRFRQINSEQSQQQQNSTKANKKLLFDLPDEQQLPLADMDKNMNMYQSERIQTNEADEDQQTNQPSTYHASAHMNDAIRARIVYIREHYDEFCSKTGDFLTEFLKIPPLEQKPEILDYSTLRSLENVKVKLFKHSAYYGQILNHQRCGKGIMVYKNGRCFEGEWQNNFKFGKGFEIFPNGNRYEGYYINGKSEGMGTYIWANNEAYDGQWVGGMKHGSGMWRSPRGDSYIGEWKLGKTDGYGVHTWVNGDRYEGQFKVCLKHGEGTERFGNGDCYEGNYVNGRPEGYGTYTWSCGSTYAGSFKNGLRHGKGVWKKPKNDGYDSFEGQYQNDKKCGYGVFRWATGNVYIGNYFEDLRHGSGKMTWTDGSYYNGMWERGQQSGEGELSIQGKIKLVGIFRDNEFIRSTEDEEPVLNEATKPCFDRPNIGVQMSLTDFKRVKNNLFQARSKSFTKERIPIRSTPTTQIVQQSTPVNSNLTLSPYSRPQSKPLIRRPLSQKRHQNNFIVRTTQEDMNSSNIHKTPINYAKTPQRHLTSEFRELDLNTPTTNYHGIFTDIHTQNFKESLSARKSSTRTPEHRKSAENYQSDNYHQSQQQQQQQLYQPLYYQQYNLQKSQQNPIQQRQKQNEQYIDTSLTARSPLKPDHHRTFSSQNVRRLDSYGRASSPISVSVSDIDSTTSVATGGRYRSFIRTKDILGEDANNQPTMLDHIQKNINVPRTPTVVVKKTASVLMNRKKENLNWTNVQPKLGTMSILKNKIENTSNTVTTTTSARKINQLPVWKPAGIRSIDDHNVFFNINTKDKQASLHYPSNHAFLTPNQRVHTNPI